jgi:hypothetical protein
VLVGLMCVATAGTFWYRTRASRGPTNLITYLPTANATVVYIDVDAMRRSGILSMIAGSKAAEELEYRQFVDATQFDYRRDLDAVAIAFKDGQVFFALRGNFHWKNLQDYAAHQGGSCRNKFCTVNGTTPQRRISFYPLKSDVMAMATSSDDFAAYQVAQKSGKLSLDPPPQPVWMLVPALALKNAETLPAGTKAYASALQGADQIVFTVGPDGDHLQLGLNVTCKDADTASALLVDFENTTNTLRKWIARENRHPNAADLSGVLIAGSFRREDRRVFGQWPLSRAFIDTLTGGSF